MAIHIQYIRVGELVDYTLSEDYRRQDFFPISLPRARSHAHNPGSRKDDVALILAYDEQKLVGYLGAIPDTLHYKGMDHRVCWYSCMWVLPEYRRHGIAKMLLEDAGKHYQNRVLISNYIPQSKAAFLKNDQFSEVAVLKGVRAYLKLDLAQILIRKNPAFRYLKALLWMIDITTNLFITLWFRLQRQKKSRLIIQPIQSLDEESTEFVAKQMQGSLFRRGAAELNWLQEFPWVFPEKPADAEIAKYYFSQYDPKFRHWLLKITDEAGSLRGIALLTRHKHELRTPYLWVEQSVMEDFFHYLHWLMLDENIPTLVTHAEDLVAVIARKANYFLAQRPSEYGFMATPEIVGLVEGNFGRLYEGDGDGMFT